MRFNNDLFMQEQCNEIRKHKWIESEKVGYDLGQSAVIDWILKYAKEYRTYAMNDEKFYK